MEPIIAPLVTYIRLTLGNFVGVVGESVIYAAAMDIEILAKIFHAYARAFDVPAGVSDTPRAIPLELLIVKLGLCEPENEVRLVFLVCVLLNALTDTDRKIVLLEVVENVVLLQLRGVEVYVSTCLVSVSLFDKRCDDLDKAVDARGCGGNHVGSLDVQLGAVGKECVGIELSYLHN